MLWRLRKNTKIRLISYQDKIKGMAFIRYFKPTSGSISVTLIFFAIFVFATNYCDGSLYCSLIEYIFIPINIIAGLLFFIIGVPIIIIYDSLNKDTIDPHLGLRIPFAITYILIFITLYILIKIFINEVYTKISIFSRGKEK